MLSPKDISGMRDTQDSSMMDTGYRLKQSFTKGDYGDGKEAWSRDGDATECGLEMKSGLERKEGNLTVIEYDATIRLPIGFEIDEKDRFEVTEFRGEAFSQVFEVITPIQKGISCNRVRVKRTEI